MSLHLQVTPRLKEELIRELVKSNNSIKHVNGSFHSQVIALQNEVQSLQVQLKHTQKNIRSQEKTEHGGSTLLQQFELQKQKYESTAAKLKTLQKQQREVQRLLQMRGNSEQRVVKLEGEVERLRNNRDRMKRELKIKEEKKAQLQSEVDKFQRKLAELETCTNQQKKVLKVKTEEVCVCVCVCL